MRYMGKQNSYMTSIGMHSTTGLSRACNIHRWQNPLSITKTRFESSHDSCLDDLPARSFVDNSGRLRHGSIISHRGAVFAHEYHLHIINVHARDLFPYVLYCAMSQLVATKLVIDLWNRRWAFLTV